MNKSLVLVVDDTRENIDILVNILSDDYEMKVALNGEKAINIAHTHPSPDLILLDIMMPEMDGYEVCRLLKQDPVTSEIPVIFLTAKTEAADEEHGFKLGAVDYITKPFSPTVIKARVDTHLRLHDQNLALMDKINERTRELNETRLKIIQRLGRAAEYRDNETGFHVVRMAHYSRLIAMAYGGNDEWVEMLYNAAPMHDVGKIGISDNILLKNGKLTDEEWKIMKQHSRIGAEIIGKDSNPLIVLSRIIALTHHEKWDGSGYPNGLKGAGIPLESRIVAVADVFDALTSERPYKKAWTSEDAAALIIKDSGTHFDPKIVELFKKVLPDILKIKDEYID
ncbi:MAG: two-component system response regulator [Gammaproteobacteria bacterium]|nr:two-component system response regulator [Gammaproteobacteria bacterium]